MNGDEIQKLLGEPGRNPFYSNTVADPWDNVPPDVSSLNEQTHKHICGMIQAQSRDPWGPSAGIVFGEAGLGKTHLLRRLLTWVRANNNVAIFVFVKPFLNPKRRRQHLLREIATNLARIEEVQETPTDGTEKRKKVNQFEFLVARIIDKYMKEEGSNFKDAVLFFRKRFPDIDAKLLKAVFDYRDSAKRVLILDWLRGGVNEDFVSVLGFPDREKMDNFDLEEEAAGIIRSLGMLLEYCRMSMVVCFDQLESMRDATLYRAFGDVVHFMVNEVSGMLPLAFTRTDVWDEQIKNNIDTAALGRLSGNTMFLEGCSKTQALELVRARVYSHPNFSGKDAEKIYQWLEERLAPKLEEGYSPRRVIEMAGREILSPSERAAAENPLPVIAKEYAQERERVAADFDLWPPDIDRMRRALEVFLAGRPDFRAISPSDDKYFSLTGKYVLPEGDGADGDCAFIINTAGHFKTVEAALTHGSNFLEKRDGARCWYITDARCKFCPPTWVKANEALEKFKNQGGNVLVLDRERAADWYALVALVFKLEAGDIDISTSTGFRPATEKDLTDYIRRGFKKDLLKPPALPPVEPPSSEVSLPEPVEKTEKDVLVVSPPVNPPRAFDEIPEERKPALEEKIVTFVKKSPMRSLSVALLQGMLSKCGDTFTYEVLLEFLTRRPDSFFTYPTADGSVVQLIR